MRTKENNSFEIIENWSKWILPVLVLFSASLFVLCTSPLYKPDTFGDINAMMTAGRSMLKGAVPLKTIVDQRGPLIYFLFELAALISSHSFFGVWLIEVGNVLIVYFISVHLAADLDLKWSYWLGVIGPIVLLGTSPIYGGGSPEEFAFTSLLYLIEVVVRARGDLTNVSMTSYFWMGLNMGLVFWGKYSLIGAFIVFFIWAGFSCLGKNDFRRLVKIICYSSTGFLLVTGLILIYYFLENGIANLFKVYFVQNLTLYNVGNNAGFFANLWSKILVFSKALEIHPVFDVIVVLSCIIALWQHEKCGVLIGTMIGEAILIAWSGDSGNLKSFPCPFLGMMPFLVIALLFLWDWLNLRFPVKTNGNFCGFLLGIAAVVCLFVLPMNNNQYLNGDSLRSTTMFQTSASTHRRTKYRAQPEFGKIMKQRSVHPTMLMLNGLDEGFFLSSGATATTKYWHQLNMPNNSYMFDSFNHTLKYKKVQFVVVRAIGSLPRSARQIRSFIPEQLLEHDQRTGHVALLPNITKKIKQNGKLLFKNYQIIDYASNQTPRNPKKNFVVYYVLMERKPRSVV